jgi:hypothetical protein
MGIVWWPATYAWKETKHPECELSIVILQGFCEMLKLLNIAQIVIIGNSQSDDIVLSISGLLKAGDNGETRHSQFVVREIPGYGKLWTAPMIITWFPPTMVPSFMTSLVCPTSDLLSTHWYIYAGIPPVTAFMLLTLENQSWLYQRS